MNVRPTIAIVGGGVAGALTAIQLSRSDSPPRVVLIDRDARFARGVAYSTTSSAHLLNVAAARMSAFPDDPDHFLRWARTRLGASTPADAFLPRRLYGDYVAGLLADACASGAGRVVERVCAAAIDLHPGLPCRVRLDTGAVVTAERVVVALGNPPPRHPSVREGSGFYGSRRYTPNPWEESGLDAIDPSADVLLVGAGLTMCDVALSLRQRGHTGTIHAVSRRGLMPRSHAPHPLQVTGGPSPESWLGVEPTARALLRAVRAACERGDWHAVIESLRPVTARLWGRLSERERVRFCAHVRLFWDVHRHRAPVEVHRAIVALVEGGALQLHTGRVRAWHEDDAGVTALLDDRRLRVAHVINCTGPDSDVHRSSEPLVQSMLRRGLIVRDPLGMGVETASNGALIAAGGRVSSWLFTLGNWRRPALWESSAVPELRAQAADLARSLTDTSFTHLSAAGSALRPQTIGSRSRHAPHSSSVTPSAGAS